MKKFLMLLSVLMLAACSKDNESDSWMVGTYICYHLSTYDGTDLASITEERILKNGFKSDGAKLDSDHKFYLCDLAVWEEEYMGTWSATSSNFSLTMSGGGPTMSMPYKKCDGNSFIVKSTSYAENADWMLFKRK